MMEIAIEIQGIKIANNIHPIQNARVNLMFCYRVIFLSLKIRASNESLEGSTHIGAAANIAIVNPTSAMVNATFP